MADQDTTSPASPATQESPSRRARFIQGMRQNQGNFRSWMQQRQALGNAPGEAQSPLTSRVQAAKAALAARSGGAAPAAVGSPAAPAAQAAPSVPAAPIAPVAPAVGPAVRAPVAAVAPAPPAAPPPMPVGGSWGDAAHLDYFSKYGPGDSGLSSEQVNALLGRPANAPNAATVAYNQAQQQFTANNSLYGVTGYQGNANQVASQVAGGAQSAGIPMGVLGSTFNQGGADYGGQQNAGNSLNGNNGAMNWNDPTVANYGVSDANYIPTLVQSLQAAKTALGTTPVTTGQVGNFVSSIPGIVQSPQFQAGMAAQQQQQVPQQQQATQAQAAPAAQYASAPAVSQPQVTGNSAPAQHAPIQSTPATQNAQPASAGTVGPGSQSASLASAIQAARQPAQQSISAPATQQPTNANNASQNAQVSAALNAQGQQQQTTQPGTAAQRNTLAPQQAMDQRAAQAGTTTKGVSQAAGGSSIITRNG